jgi:hypothetical protein
MNKFYNTPHGKAVGTVGVVHVRTATVEVHVVSVRGIVLTSTPVVAVVTPVVQRAIAVVPVAGGGHKQANVE